TLRKAGMPIKLQPQPFRLLLLLLGRPGQVVTRDEIQAHLWGDSTFVDFERGINFSINQIRAALCDNPEKPRYIETLPRIGYRFIGTITRDVPERVGPVLVQPEGNKRREPEQVAHQQVVHQGPVVDQAPAIWEPVVSPFKPGKANDEQFRKRVYFACAIAL